MIRTLPLDIGTLHFVGIGGIGMSGIAEILHNMGYVVQGSDVAEGPNIQRLRRLGIPVTVGHAAENLGAATVVVVSTAIGSDNPEITAARQRLIPVVQRSEMLAALMRLRYSVAVAGTHGKTTTTSMVAALLDAAGLDPTVINGGIINAYNTNARLGGGDWIVVEADESDGTFTKVPATVAVVTSINPEHLDFWGGFDQVREAFYIFAQNIPFYGFTILCLDHPEVQALITRMSDRRIITYGFTPQADVHALDVVLDAHGATFNVFVTNRRRGTQHTLFGVQLPMYGLHNVCNALAAISVAVCLGIDDCVIVRALSRFSGVKRRFTRIGVVDGVTVIDDYGHHPVEIAAALRAARSVCSGHVIAVVQPHRYTRLRDLFELFCTCFDDADTVIVAEVYSAGEPAIDGMHRDALVERLRAHGHRHVLALSHEKALANVVQALARPGDFVVCLGAGSITHWAHALPDALARLGAAGEGCGERSIQ
ncbi:UDP-N-acetylmuramate--alanine ligase [invertebrate metagenome]|uniref:UDP-N-acetylmuramate--L-alanine ligase n=1 Tax=invertebrate metagenome TaxID=1711999 RepID=A0A484H848_9ZZZZ